MKQWQFKQGDKTKMKKLKFDQIRKSKATETKRDKTTK